MIDKLNGRQDEFKKSYTREAVKQYVKIKFKVSRF